MKTNNIEKQLIDLGIIDVNQVELYYPMTRDNNNISVKKCNRSNVIYLSENQYLDDSSYENKSFIDYWGGGKRETALKNTSKDDNRRFEMFSDLIKNKNYLDYGTGLGGALDLFSKIANSVTGIELQQEICDYLNHSLGYDMYQSLVGMPKELKFDIISLFHVFEHVSTPLEQLRLLRERLNENGKIIIEVPHAKDALISLYNIEQFKSFTFWSEHLILHTRESLEIYLRTAGFKNIVISGYQRYPLANHLYWLSDKKPCGEIVYNYLINKNIDWEYSNILKSIDKTDTLIAIAEK